VSEPGRLREDCRHVNDIVCVFILFDFINLLKVEGESFKRPPLSNCNALPYMQLCELRTMARALLHEIRHEELCMHISLDKCFWVVLIGAS
jgi:hypothetical protein